MFKHNYYKEDTETKIFCFYTMSCSTIATIACVYYFWKSWKFVHKQDITPSEHTLKLHSQFTKTLIVQTINSALFSVFPVGLACIAMVSRLNLSFIGMSFYMPLNFLPLANATLTLYLIKSYRHYVFLLLSYRIRTRNKTSPTG
ncbi:hypothetical protein M3Y97_01118800 [Aphelenchoides bicaudatus]|nr:hypothetical protein M3Y97_01118800 [Aphelenchoides bicaudatus]